MPTLHITNGDSAADTIRRIVSDPVITMADVLHEGPCPPVDGDAWHEVRARFLSAGGYAPYHEIKQGLAATDRRIVDACARHEAIVLWFEHDLFDQLALIRTMDLMVRLKPDTTETRLQPDTTETRLKPDATAEREAAGDIPVVSGFSRTLPRASLICIGEFPGIDRFIGLGQLTPEQLATLIGTDVPITAEHYSIASAAWAAFRSPDPRQLLAIPDSHALPFLHAALRRFLAEYPSTANGLSHTEELALQALLERPATGGALFGASQAHEARPFMGDLPFFDILQGLSEARVPLVTIDAGAGNGDMRKRSIALTQAGRDVLDGKADHVRLNGIDVWRGGVHLTGSDASPWRWDRQRETLVS